MFEAMLQDDKELLQRRVLGVQRPAQAQGGLNQHFDAQLHHAEEVGSLYGHGLFGGQDWNRCNVTGISQTNAKHGEDIRNNS